MKSVGEAMAIGRTFKQAFMKAMRSRELDACRAAGGRRASCWSGSRRPRTTATSCSSRRCGAATPVESCTRAPRSTPGSCARARRATLAPRAGEDGPTRGTLRELRSFKSVDTCAAEFEAETPYFYSAYERAGAGDTRSGAATGPAS